MTTDTQEAAAVVEDVAPIKNPNLHWYVVQAASQSENAVKRAIQAKIKDHHLEDSFGDILVPEEEVVEIKDNNKKTSTRRFYPGYVFVEMELTEINWHMIKSIPKVSGFLGGTKSNPTSLRPMSEVEVRKIKSKIKTATVAPVAKVSFKEGDNVRIQAGPFMGFTGYVENVDLKNQRLNVGVTIFGRTTPVEVAFGQAEILKE